MLAAVLVGVLLTLFLVIWELDHVGVTELRPTADGTDLGFVGEDTAAEPGLLVLRIDGPLYTANVRTREPADPRGGRPCQRRTRWWSTWLPWP